MKSSEAKSTLIGIWFDFLRFRPTQLPVNTKNRLLAYEACTNSLTFCMAHLFSRRSRRKSEILQKLHLLCERERPRKKKLHPQRTHLFASSMLSLSLSDESSSVDNSEWYPICEVSPMQHVPLEMDSRCRCWASLSCFSSMIGRTCK